MPPKTFYQLVEYVQTEFSLWPGQPRAYMEIPSLQSDGSIFINRYVYKILGFRAPGPKLEWESALVHTLYETLERIRHKAIDTIPGLDECPLVLVRRPWEFTEARNKERGAIECCMNWRIAVPGIELEWFDGIAVNSFDIGPIPKAMRHAG